MLPSESRADADLVTRAGSLIRHRVHNPLQVILSETELLRDVMTSHADDPAYQGLDAIREAARRIADAIGTFDAWAREELGAAARGGSDASGPAGTDAAASPDEMVTDPALTDALVTELRLLARQIRSLSDPAPARLQPRLRRAARMAELWLKGSAAPTTTSSSAQSELRSGEGTLLPQPPAAASGGTHPEPMAEGDPRLTALLDRVQREEAERERLAATLGRKQEEWHVATHELRNAAQALTGWLDILRVAPERESAWYEPLTRAADAVLHRAEEALNLATGVQLSAEIRLRAVDLEEVAHNALDRMRPLTVEHGLRTALVSSPSGQPVMVRADAERVMQILVNLLRNSIAATPGGGGIVVCVRQEEDRGVVEVEDTGPGIPPELAEHFAHHATTHVGGGRSGIGLVLSRRLAEAMGGTLAIGPSGGRGGARLLLTLPAAP